MYQHVKLMILGLSFGCYVASGSFVHTMKHTHGVGSKSPVSSEHNEALVIKVVVARRNNLASHPHRSTRQADHGNRYVFAHIVQGNFQVYTADDWRADMTLAKDNHIDAFAINIGRDASNEQQLPLAYDVADELGFSLFLSFDMNYYGQPDSSRDVIDLIKAYAHRTSQFEFQGKPLVSTFSGEVPNTFLDNNPNYNAAWNSLKNKLGFPIYFLPCWTGVNPSSVPVIDGLFSWDAWSSASSSPDEHNRQALASLSKDYAAPISPVFFKHLEEGQGGNYVYSTDDSLVIERYMQLINSPPTFIELVTWNDYGESHYLRDPRPNANLPVGVISAHQYVDGFSHEPLLDMLSYFNLWYKTGLQPKMQTSKVYVWYRPHPKAVHASSDALPSPVSANTNQDNLYIVLFLAAGCQANQIAVTSGSKTYSSSLTPYLKGKDAILRLSAPFETGSNQSVRLFGHDGKQVVRVDGISIDERPAKYNFNYWSGMDTF